MQAELREYRTRLSVMTNGNGSSAMNAIPSSYSRGGYGANKNNSNDFLFDFPKFGDLPGSHLFSNPQARKSPSKDGSQVPGVMSRNAFGAATTNGQSAAKQNQAASSPVSRGPSNGNLSDQAAKHGEADSNPPRNVNPARSTAKQTTSTHETPNSDSPSSSSDSHQSQFLSSNGTSPESSPNFFGKPNKDGHGESCPAIDGEKSFCDQLGLACGNINNPIPAVRNSTDSASNTPNQAAPTGNSDSDFGLDFLTQQNGGQFDPVLFGDWREPQDSILSQEFGSYFDDAFPLPDLGSPSHNFTEVAPQPAPKKDLVSQIDQKMDEEVVPGEDQSKMLSCNKIWYVLMPFMFRCKMLTSASGIVCSPWTNSGMARLMSIISAPSCAPRHGAPRVAWSSTSRTWTKSCAAINNVKRHWGGGTHT
jgi:AP-1-like factor